MNEVMEIRLKLRRKSSFFLNVAFEHVIVPGETTALVGVSGSGKTTILRCLAGLIPVDEGRITLPNSVWLDTSRGIALSPQKREIGYLQQEYALFPHKTIRGNIAFGLSSFALPIRNARIAELCDLLEIGDLLDRYPNELSGGQQQRAALARSVAPRPRILLLDEPLSALDTPTRIGLRHQLRTFLQQQGISTIIVTHDPYDVRVLSDRVVIIENGNVIQSGLLAEVRSAPATPTIAQLIEPELFV